jgi:hypothetical protein
LARYKVAPELDLGMVLQAKIRPSEQAGEPDGRRAAGRMAGGRTRCGCCSSGREGRWHALEAAVAAEAAANEVEAAARAALDAVNSARALASRAKVAAEEAAMAAASILEQATGDQVRANLDVEIADEAEHDSRPTRSTSPIRKAFRRTSPIAG